MDTTRQVVDCGIHQKHARKQYNVVYIRTPKNPAGVARDSGRHEIVSYYTVFQEFFYF